MKKYFKQILLLSVIMLVLCFIPSLLYAQPDPGADPDAVVPIDGGLSILAAAGVAYGVKKIREYRKKPQEKQEQ
jgi:predicted metal-dependent HD superfamily phosphohydrolase